MSTILLSFGVRTRNWPRIDFQFNFQLNSFGFNLEFNLKFYLLRFWGLRSAERAAKSQNSRSLYQSENLFKITKIIQTNYFD